MIRTTSHDPRTPGDGGAPPPVLPDLPTLDEGPMRIELLRQIRRLEIETSRFAATNCPYDELPTSKRRGPAVLRTSELEEIRDELLAVRTELHERVVARMTAKGVPTTQDAPQAPPRRRGLRRRREG